MDIDSLIKLLTFLIVAVILLKIPVVGRYVAIINTLIHEIGHAIMSMLTGGEVEKIELFANTEGVAWSSSRFWIGRVLTGLAGYPAASLTGLLYLYLISNGMYTYVLISLIVIAVFSFIFWIRNLYGFIWIISFIAFLSFIVFYIDNAMLTEGVLLLITSIIFVESILSSIDILKLSIKYPLDAGDATSLWKSIVFIPSPIWGFLFCVQSLFVGYLGIMTFIS